MKKKKIMIIDDDQNFSEALKISLEDRGVYDVLTEAKGLQALEDIKKFNPDIIFLDIVMPDIDGHELLKDIRSDNSMKEIPVIFLTGLVSSEEIKSRGGSIGGHAFLAKPVSIEEIEKYIRKNA